MTTSVPTFLYQPGQIASANVSLFSQLRETGFRNIVFPESDDSLRYQVVEIVEQNMLLSLLKNQNLISDSWASVIPNGL